ncbi:hypothetical protein XELAEV_18047286mg [Xenopus laevis]|uniref:Uncharacterized protein n=1 Tax=Xenopus laevis TaxID=8355 RepID=A0A974H1F6_XENLA|nr:hypothetical protein XELAEV_18047286mg [Xenopus laevis]
MAVREGCEPYMMAQCLFYRRRRLWPLFFQQVRIIWTHCSSVTLFTNSLPPQHGLSVSPASTGNLFPAKLSCSTMPCFLSTLSGKKTQKHYKNNNTKKVLLGLKTGLHHIRVS